MVRARPPVAAALAAAAAQALAEVPPPRTALIAFDGCLTQQFSEKVLRWLLRDYGDNAIVEQLFHNSTSEALLRVRAYLQRSGFQLYSQNGVYHMHQTQAPSVLRLLKYLMHSTGYSTSYFVMTDAQRGVRRRSGRYDGER